MRYFNEIDQGVCPDCEDPSGFDTCSECGAEAEGIYDDDADGSISVFTCYECCWREAEQSYDPRWERAPEPEDCEMPF